MDQILRYNYHQFGAPSVELLFQSDYSTIVLNKNCGKPVYNMRM